MAIVAGIDEAGFGPVLGPLVVSTSVFDVPDELADVSMWKLLSGIVSRATSKKRHLIPIADSKKLYSGLRSEKGLEHLERGVLCMLASANKRPITLQQLVDFVAPSAWQRACEELWNGDLPLPHELEPSGVLVMGNSLAGRMQKVGIKLLDLRCEPVFAGEYNRLVAATNNKSVLLFDIASRLFVRVWRLTPPGQLAKLYVDHQGGRVHYLQGLQRVFAGCQFKVVEECETLSAYRITGDREMEIVFAVKAEDQHLPVALASMASKYLRELFMAVFNRFWQQHLPDLAPTAGYYSDGSRFYLEIQEVARRLGVEEQSIYRSR